MTKRKTKRGSKLSQDERAAIDRQRRMVCLQMASGISGATDTAAKLVAAADIINDYIVNGKRPPADIKAVESIAAPIAVADGK